MRTYEELVSEFVSRGQEKQKWIDELPIEELKTLRKGLINVAYTGIWDSWINYIDLTISLKIEEERERKLNELGI